ncbi:MAG: outer membrane protein assembly factor BamD [Pseudomonadota bacterium]|nr:outer membrane protein assembly factor BamD [Pseudomonadota bacterium]
MKSKTTLINFYQRVKLLFLVIVFSSLFGCFFFGDEELDEVQSGAEQLYDRAKNALNGGDFNNAIFYYEALEARFPFSNLARQGQIDLIYAYYRNKQPESVIDAARQFARENPTHPRVDYSLYMRGMALFSGEESFYHRWFDVSLAMRPPKDAENSFSVFAELIRRYPNSRYAPDARQRMIFLRNRLAEHENYVANFYLERGAYAAAINRATYTIETYDGSPTTSDTLSILVTAYQKLGMNDLANDTERVLKQSYPNKIIKDVEAQDEPWFKFWERFL